MLSSVTMLESSATADPYIPYGRGGAGNMRRRSTIRDAWTRIARQQDLSTTQDPNDDDELSSSSSSTAPDMSSRRTSSSTWSISTSSASEGARYHRRRVSWKRLFSSRRAEVVEEESGALPVVMERERRSIGNEEAVRDVEADAGLSRIAEVEPQRAGDAEMAITPATRD